MRRLPKSIRPGLVAALGAVVVLAGASTAVMLGAASSKATVSQASAATSNPPTPQTALATSTPPTPQLTAAPVSSQRADGKTIGPASGTMPTTTSSYYVYTPDPAKLGADGVEAGKAAGTGQRNDLIVLDFGRPRSSGTTEGSRTFDLKFASTTQIEAATEAFISGYLSNASPLAHLTVAVGTNNYNDTNDFTPAHGAAWGTMIDRINAWVADRGYGAKVAVWGANDIEGGWGPPSRARAWVDAYRGATGATLLNFGDTEGLPTADGGAVKAPNGWTFEDYWYVCWGAGNIQSLPEIYNTTFAKEWNQLVRYSLTKKGTTPMQIMGVLTMVGDSRQMQYGATLSPQQAWKTLTDLLNSDPRTAQTPTFSTDIQRNWLP